MARPTPQQTRQFQLLVAVTLALPAIAIVLRPPTPYIPMNTLTQHCLDALSLQVGRPVSRQEIFLRDIEYAGGSRTGAEGNRARAFNFNFLAPSKEQGGEAPQGTAPSGSCRSTPPGVELSLFP